MIIWEYKTVDGCRTENYDAGRMTFVGERMKNAELAEAGAEGWELVTARDGRWGMADRQAKEKLVDRLVTLSARVAMTATARSEEAREGSERPPPREMAWDLYAEIRDIRHEILYLVYADEGAAHVDDPLSVGLWNALDPTDALGIHDRVDAEAGEDAYRFVLQRRR